eukprot:TRINITY_DN11637_c0_g1_i1.p1 TRINITY_DN11637_c0_g1~~TRINITY_DN11637_c0_g1_i1.p1  ORF type:complete len:708 (+),score=134.93 TRINITY_DN11637_c0_g1_i1:61-2124(+)
MCIRDRLIDIEYPPGSDMNERTLYNQTFQIYFEEIRTKPKPNELEPREYMKKGERHLLKLIPLKIRLRESGRPRLNSTSETIFLFGYSIKAGALWTPIQTTYAKTLTYMWMSCAGLLLIVIIALILTLRMADQVADNTVSPIKTLGKLFDKLINNTDMIAHERFKFRQAQNSFEIHQLYQAITKFVKVYNATEEIYTPGNNERALLLFTDAHHIFKANANTFGEGVCLNNIGNINVQLGKYKEAIECYKQSVELASRHLESHKSMLDGTEQDLREDEIATGTKILTQLYKRSYQMAHALKLLSTRSHIKKWKEAVETLDALLTLDKNRRLDYSFSLQINIALCEIYTQLKFYHLAEKALEQAVFIFNERDRLNLHLHAPDCIYMTKIKLQRAVLEKEQGFLQKAAILLTECIEEGEFYEYTDRKLAMSLLEEIFIQSEIDTGPIYDVAQDATAGRKDIIFLLDASKSMNNNNFVNGLHLARRIMSSCLDEFDRFGLVLLRGKGEVAIPLVTVQDNIQTLSSHIDDCLKTEDEIDLVSAFTLVGRVFREKTGDNHIGLLQNSSTDPKELFKRYLIFLSDGFFQLAVDVLDPIHQILDKYKIHLCVFTESTEIKQIQTLRKIAHFHKNGKFFADNDDELCSYFLSMKQPNTDPSSLMETLEQQCIVLHLLIMFVLRPFFLQKNILSTKR